LKTQEEILQAIEDQRRSGVPMPDEIIADIKNIVGNYSDHLRYTAKIEEERHYYIQAIEDAREQLEKEKWEHRDENNVTYWDVVDISDVRRTLNNLINNKYERGFQDGSNRGILCSKGVIMVEVERARDAAIETGLYSHDSLKYLKEMFENLLTKIKE
jgi:hypothetical protein